MTRTLMEIAKGGHEKVSDKWSSYLRFYQDHMAPYQNEPVRLLEIGIQNGGSLELWSNFFPNAEIFVGCDINPKCGDLIYDDPRVQVFVGDAGTEDVRAEIEEASQGFNIIIDDGSHRSDDIVKTFALYFPMLEPGGIYIVEDLHASYFEDYQGGTEAPFSSLNFFKRLTDYVNLEHWGADVSPNILLSFFSEHFRINFDSKSLDSITEVIFSNSLVMVRKGNAGENALGRRMITGTSALVDERVAGLNDSAPLKRNESRNPMGPLGMRLEAYPGEAGRLNEALKTTTEELDATTRELVATKSELEAKTHQATSLNDALRTTTEKLDATTYELVAKKSELEAKTYQAARLNDAQKTTTEKLDTTTRELTAKKNEIEAKKGQVARLEKQVFDKATAEANLKQQLHAKNNEAAAVRAQIKKIAAELTKARRKPFKQLRKLIHYKLLRGLSKSRPVVSQKAAARFARSAAKRHPSRLPPLPKIVTSRTPLPKVATPPVPPPARSEKKSDTSTQSDSSIIRKNCGLDEGTSHSAKLLPIAESGFWDERWYKDRHWNEIRAAASRDKSLLSPLHHYVMYGWKNGYEPSPSFPIERRANLNEDPVTRFLNTGPYQGFHFEENAWFPSTRDIADYWINKENRNASRVIYTCIVGCYDDLIQPNYIEPSSDYVCFTDRKEILEHRRIGVWTVRPLVETHDSATLANRWHKMHPHELFRDYKESLYVDGNINVLTAYIFETIEERNSDILLPRHFMRSCISEELDVIARTNRINPAQARALERLIQKARTEGFPTRWGLSENNVIFRKHHQERIKVLMKAWWEMTETVAPRDQAHFSYLLWKHGFSFPSITFPNCRTLYKDFAVVRHNTKEEMQLRQAISHRISPAFADDLVAIVLSCNETFIDFLDVLLTSIIENSSADRNYDIIILNRDVTDGSKRRIRESHGSHSNFSIRFYDMTPVLASFTHMELHLEGYVPIETYNKIFLKDILDGYEKVAYIDTDIVVDRDIAELYDIDLCGRAIGASPNVANIHAANVRKNVKNRDFHTYLQKILGVRNVDQYFQAGILILDLTHRNTERLFRKCVEKIMEIKEPAFFDQCIFNSIFYGDVRYFSTEWNTVWYLQNYSYVRSTVSEDVFFDYARARNKPSIVHFAGGDKPTNKTDWRLGDYFWKYAVLSSSKDALLAKLSDAQRSSPQVAGIVSGRAMIPEMVRVLVHVHLYYEDQLPFMMEAISNLGEFPRDVYFTIQRGSRINKTGILDAEPNCKFVEVPNLGYDVFPFIEVLRRVDISKYDYILKLHTKAPRTKEQGSVYSIDVPGYTWRDALVSALTGSPDIFRANIRRLQNDKTIGALGCEDFIFSTHENNEENSYNLPKWRSYLDIRSGSVYVGGTMFLARAFPFERFNRLHDRPDLFKGGSMSTKSHKDFAHIVERLCGIVIENEGMTVKGVPKITGAAALTGC